MSALKILDVRLMRLMAAEEVRVNAAGRPIVSRWGSREGLRGITNVDRIVAAGHAYLDAPNAMYLLTAAGVAALAAHDADRLRGMTDTQRALQEVAVRRVD